MTVPLHAHKVTARNDGRHIVPLTIVEQKFKFRIELHPCAFESGGDELCTVPNALNKFIRFIHNEDMEFWGKCFATASFLSTQYTLGRSRFEICRVFSYFQDAR